ncbi:MAG: nickel/cobalt transporter, partial [Bacteroidota bacterium]
RRQITGILLRADLSGNNNFTHPQKIMNRFLTILFVLTGIICTPNIFAQNPLFSNSEPTDSSTVEKEKPQPEKERLKEEKSEPSGYSFSVWNRFIQKNTDIQRRIRQKFAHIVKEYKTEGNKGSIAFIFFLTFLYGIFHSLGPGHGKVFIFSYILTEKPQPLKAIGMSYIFASIHALSGLVVSLAIIFTLNTYSSSETIIADSSTIISRFSFGLITILGIYLLYTHLRNRPHHSAPHNQKPAKLSRLIYSIGLIPCPATIITVTFLSSVGLLSIGIISVLFIILGMGVTISAISIISLFSKKLVLRTVSEENKTYTRIYTTFSLIGASLLILFGTWFFWGTFY